MRDKEPNVDVNEKDTTNINATYFYNWITGLDFDDVELNTTADLTAILAGKISDTAKALAICATPGVELDHVDWDKLAGHIFTFATTDPGIAQWLGFDEMLLDDAEDFEPAPWAVQS
jgi:hypothetical protein